MLYDGEVGSVPWLWIKLQLCRLFHCTPAELEGNDPDEMMLMLELLGAYYETMETKRELYGGR